MTLQRYLTLVIAWCIAPLLVLAMGLGYLQFGQARDGERAEAQRLAGLLAHGVEQMVLAHQAGLQALATSPWLDDPARWPDLHRQTQGIARLLGGAVLLVDAEGRMRLHSGVPWGDALPALPQPAGRTAVALALDSGRPAVGDPFIGPMAHEPLVAVAVPVLRGPRVACVLLHVVPVRTLEAVLGGLDLPRGWSVMVNGSQGRPIVRRDVTVGDRASTQAEGMLRFSALPASVPWSAEVLIPPVSFAQHLGSAAALPVLVLLLGATLISVLGGTWATQRLARSVRSLAAPAPAPSALGELDEFRQTRRLLDDARTRHEAAVASLRVREEQLRGIFASASEAIITTDASQTIVLANPAAARMFGRPVEVLTGLPLSQLVPERLREMHRRQVDEFGRNAEGSRPMGGRPAVVGLRADGREFTVEAAISQVKAGEVQLYTVILHDVTERIAAQADIAAGKARLEAMLESLDDGLVIADARHHIVEVNAAFLRLYGFASKAPCLLPIADYEALLEISTLDGRALTHEQWTLPRALRGERGSGVELQVRHRDSGRRWIGSFSFAPIRDAGGEIAGAVFSVRDVTEQKRLADELKASHRDLERLLAAHHSVQEAERLRIARELHDGLQQVLAAIRMDIGSILATLKADPSRLPALVNRMDGLAAAAIVSSRRIVNDLRPQLLEEFGLVAALELLAAQFMERVPVRVDFESDPACSDGGEPSDAIGLCLFRVAQEALNNVAKHARAHRVDLRLSRTDSGGWELRVADDGAGMTDQDRHKPTSFGLRGMGERLRALGGVLEVDSEPGHGVVVTARVGAGVASAPHGLVVS